MSAAGPRHRRPRYLHKAIVDARLARPVIFTREGGRRTGTLGASLMLQGCSDGAPHWG